VHLRFSESHSRSLGNKTHCATRLRCVAASSRTGAATQGASGCNSVAIREMLPLKLLEDGWAERLKAPVLKTVRYRFSDPSPPPALTHGLYVSRRSTQSPQNA
jgi:hypothetical protein